MTNDNDPSTPNTGSRLGMLSSGLLGLLVAFSSSGFIQKYGGTLGLLGYAMVVCVIFVMMARFWHRISRPVQRASTHLTLLFLLGLAAVHLGLHHLEDGRGLGRSSDRDEGLEIAVTRLCAGENPYYPSHPEAGPLSVLPGAILLATPFVAIGSVGLQNIFWIGVFLMMAQRRVADRAGPLLLLATALATSPSAQYEIISGGDMIANGAYTACFFLLAWETWTRPASSSLSKISCAVLLGLGLASRANFILLLPLFSAAIWRVSGARTAVIATASVIAFYLVTIVPFYLLDPAAFTPLKSREKLMFSGQTLEWADEAILGLTCLVAAVLAIRLHRGPVGGLIKRFQNHATSVIITPMIGMVLLASIIAHKLDFRFMHDRFGLMYLFFAILGCACVSAKQEIEPRGDAELPRGFDR